MTTKTELWGAGAPQLEKFAATFSSLIAQLRRNWASRRTRMAIADLDDRTLDDVGLDPSYARRSHSGMVDWVVQSHSGTARLVFIGR